MLQSHRRLVQQQSVKPPLMQVILRMLETADFPFGVVTLHEGRLTTHTTYYIQHQPPGSYLMRAGKRHSKLHWRIRPA